VSRFYVPPESIRKDRAIIEGEEAHHIADVMRLGKGDAVTFFDGTGKEYAGEITSCGKGKVEVKIKNVIAAKEEGPKITLIQAIPKKDLMDDIVKKTTELGVARIIPVITKRTVVRFNDKKRLLRRERWEKIAKEAAKQCGRMILPAISHICKFEEVFEELGAVDLGLIPCLAESAIPIKEAIKRFDGGPIAVMIGPEGDFTNDEIRMAERSGFKPISLGKRVLRCDTASLAVLSILNYETTERKGS